MVTTLAILTLSLQLRLLIPAEHLNTCPLTRTKTLVLPSLPIEVVLTVSTASVFLSVWVKEGWPNSLFTGKIALQHSSRREV